MCLGIVYLSLFKMPMLFEIWFVILLMCVFQFRLLSMMTPRNFVLSTGLISVLLILILIFEVCLCFFLVEEKWT
jgi:hypothetical protein